MNKTTLNRAAKALGVEKESLTKENRPLFDEWLAKQAEKKPVEE